MYETRPTPGNALELRKDKLGREFIVYRSWSPSVRKAMRGKVWPSGGNVPGGLRRKLAQLAAAKKKRATGPRGTPKPTVRRRKAPEAQSCVAEGGRE